MDELFDVFESPDSGSKKNKMAKVEKDKELDAKSRAEELLKEMMSGIPSTSSTVQESATDPPQSDQQPPSTGKNKGRKRRAEKEEDASSPTQNGSQIPEKKGRQEEGEAEKGDGGVEDDLDLDEGALMGAEDLGLSLQSLPRNHIHKLQTEENCLHEVVIPHESEYKPLTSSNLDPAKKFPFVLDPFQKEALLCLDNNESVLVSAHTSAGKTVVALYAIAMSLRDKQRVIYTSPIKALSNQKYRELYEEFSDVGLMTGDVTINPTASCLVMTTEILRSMLYRGSEIMREVGWVIFDEIHYMRDKDRGVVWEETIILLPSNVHHVFLSATIPNARQFAEWICYLHKQPVHVVYTDYRPVPLRHFIFPEGDQGIHMIVDEQGNFKDANFERCMSKLSDLGDAGGGKRKKRFAGAGGSGQSSIFEVVRMIMERQLEPVIVFSFSRRDCEAYAQEMSRMDFSTDTERGMVQQIFDNAIDVLSDEDKALPQVSSVLPYLLKGIGIHHSGLLPILKETIEILFGEGLIKALFATETFAMGLNMPARTVLFTSAQKFDGTDFRWLTGGEYIQMSGRAGRRGIDSRGLVIMMVDQKLPTDVAKTIIKGAADPLNSQFRLTYNMVLNLLRVDGINPEFMLERSFYQFQNYAALPQLYSKMHKLEEKYKGMTVPRELEISGYHSIKCQIASLGLKLQEVITKPNNMVPFLQPGRLVHIKNENDDFGWGSVVNYQKKMNNTVDPLNTEPVYIVDVLICLSKECINAPKSIAALKPATPGEKGQMEVVPVMLKLIHRISAARIFYPADLRPLENRMSVWKSIQEVQNRFPDGLPILDPIEDMQIKDKSLKELVKKIQTLEERMFDHPLRQDPALLKIYQEYEEKLKAEEEWKVAKTELKKAKSLLQMDELKCRKRVLRRLGYADDQDVITLKGRVACEISAADELVLTEMMFNGAFNELKDAECGAILSCFVFQENAPLPELSNQLTGILRQMQDTARRIAKVSTEAKLPLDEETYVGQFRPHLMDVVHSWCQGVSFAKICEKTDVFEGSIIRALRRLEELLRETCSAAKAIGNAELEKTFTECIAKLKRDIVFAASLYL